MFPSIFCSVWFIQRDLYCDLNWLMDHFSPDLRNSQRETVRFVISLRRILTSSVRYLSLQHMVLSPQTVTVTRQTITTSVFTTTHYILEGEENCLAETHWVLRLPRRTPQNEITSRPICTASRETERQIRKCASINTQFYIFVSKCNSHSWTRNLVESAKVCDIPDYGTPNQSSSRSLHPSLSL
jgi:hypothetical protein